jgi:hypothetical protein
LFASPITSETMTDDKRFRIEGDGHRNRQVRAADRATSGDSIFPRASAR